MKSKQKSILLYSNFFHVFGQAMIASVFAIFALRIGASPWQIGLIIGLYNLTAGLVNIFVGRFEDGKARMKAFVLTGYLLTIISMILFIFVTKASELYYVQALTAIGVGIYSPAWKSLYTQSQTKGKEASLWGVFDGGNMIVYSGAAVIAGWLANMNAFHLMFMVVVVLYLISASFALALEIKR